MIAAANAGHAQACSADLDDGLAVVDTAAGREEISIALVAARPGDVVLVHAKEAIAVVEQAKP